LSIGVASTRAAARERDREKLREDLAEWNIELEDDDVEQPEEDEDEADELPAPLMPCEVDEHGVMGVHPDIWESVMVFQACWHQWSVLTISGGMGPGGIWYEGLDHSKVQSTMEMMKIKNLKQVLADLHVMEAVARVERNRRANGK
jgi:hypothetical protein